MRRGDRAADAGTVRGQEDTFVASGGHFLSRATKSTKKRPWKPMVSTLPSREEPLKLRCFLPHENWSVEISPKCCMVSSSPSLVRLPAQNVECFSPTFLSGAAARVEAGTIPDLRQNAVFQRKRSGRRAPKTAAQRGSRDHRSLAAFLFPFSFRWWKEKGPSETGHADSAQGVRERQRGAGGRDQTLERVNS